MNSDHPRGRGHSQGAVGGDRYLAVRAAFIAQGTSLNRWCLGNGVSRPYAAKALRGDLTGAKALALRNMILKAAGLAQ